MNIEERRKKTYRTIIERPTRQDILWSDIIDLMRSKGCKVEERPIGSRLQIIFSIGPLRSFFAVEYGARFAYRSQVDTLRVFLGNISRLRP